MRRVLFAKTGIEFEQGQTEQGIFHQWTTLPDGDKKGVVLAVIESIQSGRLYYCDIHQFRFRTPADEREEYLASRRKLEQSTKL